MTPLALAGVIVFCVGMVAAAYFFCRPYACLADTPTRAQPVRSVVGIPSDVRVGHAPERPSDELRHPLVKTEFVISGDTDEDSEIN